MDVTQQNFIQLLPEITSAIKDADFIGIDTELSGLTRNRNWTMFDSPAERFALSVELSRGFFVMQFGLSCFRRLNNPKEYSSTTYNFFIFPQRIHGAFNGDIDRTFSLQTSAIGFLSLHNFDFNKLFRDGLSYLTLAEQAELTNQLRSENHVKLNSGDYKIEPFTTPREYTALIQKELDIILNKVKMFKQNRSKPDTPDTYFALQTCNTKHKKVHMRRVLASQPFFECIELDEKDENLFVRILEPHDKEKRRINTLIMIKGFLEIIELIILNKKPIVGHNLHLDLIQIINQFVEPLSTCYKSYKETCIQLFPYIYDTKYIFQKIFSQSTSQSSLEHMYRLAESRASALNVTIKQTQSDQEGEIRAPHQAGYDAFMSGYSFAVLCEEFLAARKKHKIQKDDPEMKPTSIALNETIQMCFANHINMSYSHDLKFYNLGGDDEVPPRDHVFYVEHPSSWELRDLFNLFKTVGGVTCSRISETSHFCALREKCFLELARRMAMDNLPKATIYKPYKIYSYKYYVDTLKKQ